MRKFIVFLSRNNQKTDCHRKTLECW